MVHLLVAREVLGDGLRRNVLQHNARARELARLGAEAAQVAAKDGMTALREQARYAGQKFNMVALDIPGAAAHLGRVRERGRVDKDQVPAVARLTLVANPGEHVAAHKVMLRSHKAVLAHVALGPVQVGVREVDRHGLLDAAIGRVAGGSAGVGKQVEEAARLLGVLAHQVAGDTVVQEDADVQVVVKVDGKGEAALFDEREATACDIGALARAALAGALLAVLRAAARTHAGLGVHMLGGNIQDARRDGQDVEHTGLGQRGVDGLGRRVFGDDEPAARRLRATLVQVDSGGVVGQVGIVDAVAAHALALGPLAAQACVLAQAVGELLGLGDEHGQRLAVAQVERGGRFGHEGVGGFVADDVVGVRGLALGICAGRSFKCCGGVVERGPNLNSCLFIIGHDGDGARGLGVERAGHKAIAGERGDRCRSELGGAAQLADERHGVVHERKRGLGGVCDQGGTGNGTCVVQHGGGLGGAKIDKALVAGTLNHALGGFACGGVNIHGNDARLALACRRLALARLGAQLLPQGNIVQLPALKAPALAGGARGAVG